MRKISDDELARSDTELSWTVLREISADAQGISYKVISGGGWIMAECETISEAMERLEHIVAIQKGILQRMEAALQ